MKHEKDELGINEKKRVWFMMNEFNISLLMAAEYYDKNINYINTIENILESNKTKNRKRCIALLHILTNRFSFKMIKKYCRKNNLSFVKHVKKDFLLYVSKYTEKYKLELLSGLLFNKKFYDAAIKWYNNIDAFKNISRPNIIKISVMNITIYKRIAITITGIILILGSLFLFRNFYPGIKISSEWRASIEIHAEGNVERITLNSPIEKKYGSNNQLRERKNINYKKAANEFSKAIKFNSDDASAYYNRAVTNAARNVKPDEVINDFNTAINLGKLKGDNNIITDAYYALGVYYWLLYEHRKELDEDLRNNSINAFNEILNYSNKPEIIRRIKNNIEELLK